jgi:hypothetical protein
MKWIRMMRMAIFFVSRFTDRNGERGLWEGRRMVRTKQSPENLDVIMEILEAFWQDHSSLVGSQS